MAPTSPAANSVGPLDGVVVAEAEEVGHVLWDGGGQGGHKGGDPRIKLSKVNCLA